MYWLIFVSVLREESNSDGLSPGVPSGRDSFFSPGSQGCHPGLSPVALFSAGGG